MYIFVPLHILGASHPIFNGESNVTIDNKSVMIGRGHIGIFVPSFIETTIKTPGKHWLKTQAYPSIQGITTIESKFKFISLFFRTFILDYILDYIHIYIFKVL